MNPRAGSPVARVTKPRQPRTARPGRLLAPRPSQQRGRLGSPRTCFRQEPADAASPESHSSTLAGVRGHVSGVRAAPWACWHRPGRGAGVSGRGAPALQADRVPAEVQCGRPAGVREPPGAG